MKLVREGDTYLCTYCHQPCCGPMWDDDVVTNNWWNCKPCNVSYWISYKGKLRKLLLDTPLRDRQYSLQLLYDTVETRIVMYPSKVGDTLVEVAFFPFLVTGVTPNNVRDKIITYINFS